MSARCGLGKFQLIFVLPAVLALQLVAASTPGFASELKVPLPGRGNATPAQKLNREGVAALKHGHHKKAKELFYKAYLLDPEDPFTLNNLGYMAELDGDADRALRYYALAAKQHTDAVIDQSNEAALKGKPLDEVFRQVEDSDRQVSKVNEEAIVLLQAGHVIEAKNLLQSAQPRFPHDPFLLNNLGYALETIGDIEGAQRAYSEAASLHSTKKVIVTPRQKWRGRPISEVAAANAVAVSEQIAKGEGTEAATARLNLRGVASLNDNHPDEAREFFLQAYKRDPQNAFTLNNLGYVSEMAGDRESAQTYYEAARSGRDANAKVSYATRRDAEGQKIDKMADENQLDVEATLKSIQETRRRQAQPVELQRRNNSTPDQEATPVPPLGMQAPSLPNLPPPDPDKNPQPQQPQSQPHK